MSKIKQRLLVLGKILIVFLGIVIFPIGLFLLGYIIGSNKGKKKFIVDEKNPSKLIETQVLTEKTENEMDKVVI